MKESVEIKNLEDLLKNVIDKNEVKKTNENLYIFDQITSYTIKLGEDYLNKLKELNDLKTICNGISSKIDEAILIIDNKGEIVFKNEGSQSFIKLKDKKLYYEAIRNSELITLISDALKNGEENVAQIYINETPYEVDIFPIVLKEKKHFLAIFKKLSDLKSETLLKTQFLEAVSHEMKTPLSSILGTVEILESESFIKKKGQKFLEILKENSERLKKLTERILKLSEIESGRNTLNEVVDFSKLSSEVVEKFANLFKEKGIELSYTIQQNSIIRGNYFLLEDVLINLLENALKYTEQGKVSLNVLNDEKFVYITVEDTGKGIKEENVEKIFEPFYREDSSRNEIVKGTGLGLTITKRIVDMHSGEIKVESKLGIGTKFTLKFPKAS
ncbi:sensor histidine kinase [Caldisericum exile]|uniref:sensor histidine kinase n=1 Tax=Caldisericum exile TaxID=693075 RepID=UPI0002FF57B0|nr:HAMP domain-containing sensor histidine kinase [Caldisericum exile]